MGSIPIRFRQTFSGRRNLFRFEGHTMPPRRPKKFSASKEAKRRARATLGSPPATRVIKDKRLKPPKHKKSLIDQD